MPSPGCVGCALTGGLLALRQSSARERHPSTRPPLDHGRPAGGRRPAVAGRCTPRPARPTRSPPPSPRGTGSWWPSTRRPGRGRLDREWVTPRRRRADVLGRLRPGRRHRVVAVAAAARRVRRRPTRWAAIAPPEVAQRRADRRAEGRRDPGRAGEHPAAAVVSASGSTSTRPPTSCRCRPPRRWRWPGTRPTGPTLFGGCVRLATDVARPVAGHPQTRSWTQYRGLQRHPRPRGPGRPPRGPTRRGPGGRHRRARAAACSRPRTARSRSARAMSYTCDPAA